MERKKGRIRIEATDNIMVAKVFVTIFDEEGKILEMGDAIRQKGNWWKFATHIQGKKIRVQAWDLADNHTKMVV